MAHHVSKESDLGRILRDAREAAGLSIRQLSSLSGVGRMVIFRLESNALTELPSARHLAQLARALELNDADLFLLAGLPVPNQYASLDVMLRVEYGLPPEGVSEAKQTIGELIKKYDGNVSGNQA